MGICDGDRLKVRRVTYDGQRGCVFTVNCVTPSHLEVQKPGFCVYCQGCKDGCQIYPKRDHYGNIVDDKGQGDDGGQTVTRPEGSSGPAGGAAQEVDQPETSRCTGDCIQGYIKAGFRCVRSS